jgi:hypothetical protein
MAESGVIDLGRDSRALNIPYWCPNSFNKVGIAFTGGIDSTALMCMLLSVYPPDSIHIFHVEHYATPIMYKVAARLGITSISIVPAPTSMHNMMRELCLYANENTDVEAVYLALNENQVVGDESAYFNIGVRVPFSQFNKQHAIDLIYKLNYGFIIHECHSCEREESIIELQHCGECSHCKERMEGFKLLGLEDPATYKNKEK